MAYKTLQSQAETDYQKWLNTVQQEEAKAAAANVQGFNSYQDMLNYQGTQNYDTGGRSGDNSRPVAPGTSGADEFWLSDQGYDIVRNAKNMYAQATSQAERDYWHNVAEQERAKAGYSGGSDGSMYISAAPQDYTLLHGLNDDTDRGYDGGYGSGADGYNSQYGSTIDSLLSGLLNREAFSYNKDTDELYQQYKESYTRGGQRAMQDVLAQISARTGGLASSYGTSASQQTYNNYMAALADKVPELYQMRYNMYLDEINMQREDLNTVLGIDSMYYDRYRDTVGDQQWQQQFDYNAYRDSIADSQWNKQFDYGVTGDRQALAQSQIDAILKAGSTPSAELLAQAGYSGEYAAALQNYYNRKSTAKGSGGVDEETTSMDYNGLFEAAMDSGHPKSYIANNYKRFGFTSSTGLYDDYMSWEENGGGLEVDMNSVLALGYGPINEDKLDELVASGEVAEYQDGNMIKFYRRDWKRP